ncbi:MAG: hypothetical protein V3V88_03375, partial [Dehalococcoidia bacterium]
VAMGMIHAMFENVLGVSSPAPSPINEIYNGLKKGDSEAAIAFNALMESAEFFPMASNLKYGGHIGGPVVEYIGELTKTIAGNDLMYKDLIPKAMKGDKRALASLAELVGTGLGIAGTGQVTKYVKGKARGESDIGALLGRFTQTKKSGGRGRSRRGRSRRRSRR